MPPLIVRVAPTKLDTTAGSFKLLVVPIGFANAQERLDAVNQTWNKLLLLNPFNKLGKFPDAPPDAIAVYCWRDEPPAITLQQSGLRLSIPLAQATAIGDALSNVQVPDAGHTGAKVGSDVWPRAGMFGRTGSLVALLSKGNTVGELYELSPSQNYPTPVVGAVVTGDEWYRVIARALAQTYCGLVDEFERPEPEFLTANPDVFTALAPNVLFITAAQRAAFVAGGGATGSGVAGLTRWQITEGAMLPFFPHQGNDAITTKQPRRGGISLIEGGGGFRFNAIRADFDCIMRRTPYSTTLPVQDPSSFCKVCARFLQMAFAGRPYYSGLVAGSVEIDRQQLYFDQLSWKDKPAPLVSTPSKPVPLTAAGFGVTDRKPNWRLDVSVDATSGLKVSNLNLFNRDLHLDPFFNATEICKSISFANLSVKYRPGGPQDSQQTKSLTFADAFADSKGVTLRLYKNGSDNAQAGVKASFTWTIPNVMTIEAEASLVVKDARADFDPGGAGLACRYLPQLSMLYRRVKGGPRKLQVDSLSGTVVLQESNVLPVNLQMPTVQPSEDPNGFYPHLQEMRTGKVVCGMFTDSNKSFDDSRYELDPGPTLTWKSGRKLASATTPTGTGARLFYLQGKAPILPHWSWLFDYATPRVAQKRARPVVVAYHAIASAPVDVTKDGRFNGGQPRSPNPPSPVTWPLDQDQAQGKKHPYAMTIEKLARQGEYDNMHVAAEHGPVTGTTTDKNATVTPAPFCADMCNHLHFRWGSMATLVASAAPYAFYGWGAGKVGQGANRVLGAPLVPPNQHVELDLDPSTQGIVGVSYAVTAVRPGQGERQVFLEQGLAFIFSYFGRITPAEFSQLGTVFGFGGNFDTGRSRTQDLLRRELFDHVYKSIKFFATSADDMARDFVLQTPSAIGPDGFLIVPPAIEEF